MQRYNNYLTRAIDIENRHKKSGEGITICSLRVDWCIRVSLLVIQ